MSRMDGMSHGAMDGSVTTLLLSAVFIYVGQNLILHHRVLRSPQLHRAVQLAGNKRKQDKFHAKSNCCLKETAA